MGINFQITTFLNYFLQQFRMLHKTLKEPNCQVSIYLDALDLWSAPTFHGPFTLLQGQSDIQCG